MAFDVDAPSFRVFGAEKLDDRLKVTRNEGHLVCIDHMPNTQQYVASTTDLMLSVYCEHTGELRKSFRTQQLQVCMTWVDSHHIL